MISTRDLSDLPEVNVLLRLMQSLAMLDAILCPQWDLRYFSFNHSWQPGEQMASMRNGQGDHYFALFDPTGCWLKGFDHEAPMTPFATNPPKVAAGVLDNVPEEFSACLGEPAFLIEETTFCIWRCYGDQRWQRGRVEFPDHTADPDGSAHLLRHLDCRAETYHEWAEEYFERNIPLWAVKDIYASEPLSQQILNGLNPEISLETVAADAEEIGYLAA